MFCFSSSLDKELVRLVEERKAKEAREAALNQQTTNNEIKVKPIVLYSSIVEDMTLN